MKSRIALLFIFAFMSSTVSVHAQGVSINDDGTLADGSAVLDVKSTTQGLLIPRMNFGEMFLITDPAVGLMVYCTTFDSFYFHDGTTWNAIGGSDDEDWTLDEDNMYSNNTGMIGIGTTTVLPTHKLTIENNDDDDALRLIGPGMNGYGAKLNFGDGDYVFIHEFWDDKLLISASGGLGMGSNYNIEMYSNYKDVKIYTPVGSTSIKDDTSDPDESAILDVNSDTKGMLIPRMTTEQIAAISGPADGLQVYNTANGKLYIFVSLAGIWKEVSFGSAIIAPPFEQCGDLMTDDRDGQVYATVEINGLCWMAENLNYGTMVSYNIYQNNNSTHEKYCYNNSSSYCDQLGGLYQWHEIMDYSTTEGAQGLCMDGWHIPTDTEWTDMEVFLEANVANYNPVGWRGSVVGNKLKKAGTGSPYNWSYGNNGTNESGFTALPGGLRSYSGGLGSVGTNGLFWTSTQSGSNAYHRQMYTTYGSVYRAATYKTNGLSVRCVKDE